MWCSGRPVEFGLSIFVAGDGWCCRRKAGLQVCEQFFLRTARSKSSQRGSTLSQIENFTQRVVRAPFASCPSMSSLGVDDMQEASTNASPSHSLALQEPTLDAPTSFHIFQDGGPLFQRQQWVCSLSNACRSYVWFADAVTVTSRALSEGTGTVFSPAATTTT